MSLRAHYRPITNQLKVDECLGLLSTVDNQMGLITEHWGTYQEEPKQYICSENQQQNGDFFRLAFEICAPSPRFSFS